MAVQLGFAWLGRMPVLPLDQKSVALVTVFSRDWSTALTPHMGSGPGAPESLTSDPPDSTMPPERLARCLGRRL